MPKLFSAVAKSVTIGLRRTAHRTAPIPLEALELRTHLSVSQNAEGWTVVTPEADSRLIYVSTSGSDGNNGRSPENPVRTIAKGESLVRDDSADQLLFKRGDVWNDQTFGSWWKSGKSPQAPLLIGAYGAGDRPRINTGQETGFEAVSNKTRVDHVSIIGIQLVAHGRLPGDDFQGSAAAIGVRMLAPTKNFLIEDCYIAGYTNNISFQAFYNDLADLRVRRSVIVDSYSPAWQGHSQGLYAEGVKGLTLEENVFDHNGWNDDISGAGATAFNHNAYIRADNSGVVVRGNVFARGSSHGLQARAGGIIENNLFVENAIGMTFGRVNGSPGTAGGVSGHVKGNVFLGSETSIQGVERGWAIDIANTKAGAGVTVSDNIFAGDGTGSFPAISVGIGDEMENKSDTVGVNDLTIRDNVIYKWAQGIRLEWGLRGGEKSPDGLNDFVVRNNDFQRLQGEAVLHDADYSESAETWAENRYNADHGRDGGGRPDMTIERDLVKWDKWKSEREKSAKLTKVSYPAPDRTAGTYNAALGGKNDNLAFVAELRKMSSQLWRAQYTPRAAVEYVKTGFGKATATDPGAPPAPPAPPATPGEPSQPADPGQPAVNPDPQPGGLPAVAPVATANVPEEIQLTAGAPTLTFSVTYIDDTGGIDLATLNSDDLRVLGRRGFDQPATLVSVEPAADGNAAVATYAVQQPDGDAWKRADRGTYTVVANENAVRDAQGLPLPSAELAEFKLTVAKAPPPPPPDKIPTVKKARVIRRDGVHTVSATFSEDVASSIDAADLVILAEDGSRAVDPAVVSFAYDAEKKIATWTLPAELAKGRYRVVLSSGGITDSAGQPLDGDRNGQAGDDFAPQKWFRV